MSSYNRWQNRSLYKAADTLNDMARKKDRGAFFGSIHETLCHLLWGDQMWMARFADTPAPIVGSIAESPHMIASWEDLRVQRFEFDERIVQWSGTVSTKFIASDLSWYSGALKTTVTKPTGFLIAHMFNHQTHHRGQVHAMLTHAGAKPEDTDLFAMPS